MSKRPKPIVLTVLDGWGYRAETKANAIALARKPTYDRLLREYPNTLIHTSGPFVGLPEGQMGNSEVGHLNIGAGRIVHMDITRIEALSIETREVATLLSEIMTDDPGEAKKLEEPVSPQGPGWLTQLESRFHAPLLTLIARHEIS